MEWRAAQEGHLAEFLGQSGLKFRHLMTGACTYSQQAQSAGPGNWSSQDKLHLQTADHEKAAQLFCGCKELGWSGDAVGFPELLPAMPEHGGVPVRDASNSGLRTLHWPG